MRIIKIIFPFLLFAVTVFSQTLPDSSAVSFIKALISDSPALDKYVLPDELNLANRLGITYAGENRKYLISNDIDASLKKGILDGKIKYDYKIEKLDDDYSKLILSIPSANITKEYFFKKSFLVSAPYYYSAKWKTFENGYFVFHISDTTLFNNYSAAELNNFVKNMIRIMKFTDTDINLLKNNKIHYFLCKDDNEIHKLTGFTTRGIFYIPFDYIITTYNCHYHELLHLLINYKLKNLSLYTLPFLQEGFAVAYGGRGGKEPDVILETGEFLESSGFVNYNTMLSRQDFYNYDATISYPVSGLYNKFLIETIGFDNYLKLYIKYSTDEKKINSLKSLNPIFRHMVSGIII